MFIAAKRQQVQEHFLFGCIRTIERIRTLYNKPILFFRIEAFLQVKYGTLMRLRQFSDSVVAGACVC